MRIEHIAIWTTDLEKMKHFYTKYFQLKSTQQYTNTRKKFASYFLYFENDQTRIELMHKPELVRSEQHKTSYSGLTHLAFSVDSRENVDKLTELLRKDGFTIAGEPRVTGDGYYESVILDPEGNSVEITE